jgi:alpha-amylase
VIEDELGNFDYLMGADIELRNPFVREELKKWGKWYCELTKVDGFRLDAVKHMSTNFVKEWLDYLRGEFKRDFFTIAEYWSGKPEVLQNYIDALEGRTHLMDVPLHNNFHEAGKSDSYDLRNLLKGTLLERRPERTITFVDNHDTQPMQTLESPVADSFKLFAYAMCLLRLEGLPCVFFPDVFGAKYHDGAKHAELIRVKKLRKLMKARLLLAYGEQHDEFHHKKLIGWTRSGIIGKEYSGLAVLLNRSKEKRRLEMSLGPLHSRKKFVDVTGKMNEIIETNKDGVAIFPVNNESVAVWIREEALSWF